MVSGLTFKPLIYFELIFVYGVRYVQFHPFAFDCPVSPARFIEEIVLSLLYILGSFVVN